MNRKLILGGAAAGLVLAAGVGLAVFAGSGGSTAGGYGGTRSTATPSGTGTAPATVTTACTAATAAPRSPTTATRSTSTPATPSPAPPTGKGSTSSAPSGTSWPRAETRSRMDDDVGPPVSRPQWWPPARATEPTRVIGVLPVGRMAAVAAAARLSHSLVASCQCIDRRGAADVTPARPAPRHRGSALTPEDHTEDTGHAITEEDRRRRGDREGRPSRRRRAQGTGIRRRADLAFTGSGRDHRKRPRRGAGGRRVRHRRGHRALAGAGGGHHVLHHRSRQPPSGRPGGWRPADGRGVHHRDRPLHRRLWRREDRTRAGHAGRPDPGACAAGRPVPRVRRPARGVGHPG